MKLKIRIFQKSDEEEVIKLWEKCGLVVPWNNPQLDIERKLNENAKEILIGLVEKEIVATTFVGYDGHRGWVYYLGVKPKYRKMGFGNHLMEAAEQHLIKFGCPKINIMVRKSNSDVINFYESIGYKKDNVITLSKRLIPDN